MREDNSPGNASLPGCIGRSVIGNKNVGGLVGLYRSLTLVTACFWDTQSSGQTTNLFAIGKTTAEMQTAGTFIEAGWDFVGETKNGTEDIWWILEGQDYPQLLEDTY